VPKTRVVEVPGVQAGVRVFVVHSEEREQYERGLRQSPWSGCGRNWKPCRAGWRREN
jgi:hypothetical protein